MIKKMLFTSLFFLLLFNLSCHPMHMNYGSSYYHGFGLTGSLYGFKSYGYNFGIGYNSIQLDGIGGGGGIFRAEYENCNTLDVSALKIGGGVYFYALFIMGYIGLSEVNYFHNGATYVSIRPEIGYGIGFFNLTYSRNISGKSADDLIPKNLFSVNVFIPILNKTKRGDTIYL